jgi:signal peptidase I
MQQEPRIYLNTFFECEKHLYAMQSVNSYDYKYKNEPNGVKLVDNSSRENMIVGSEHNREGWRSVLSTILILALAPLIAWMMITFVFQSYEVEGASMESTLQDKDRLIVLKTGKTIAEITNQHYIPARGEIIIFHKTGLESTGSGTDKQLIKRVIGLPGERVVVKDGTVTVFNSEKPNGFDPDAGEEHGNSEFTAGNVDITVPEGEVFVLGDNRNNSLDSRSFGPVRSEDIIGKLVFRLFPINKAEGF